MTRIGAFDWTGRNTPVGPQRRRGTSGRFLHSCKGNCGRMVSVRHPGDAWCGNPCLPTFAPVPPLPKGHDDPIDLADIPF